MLVKFAPDLAEDASASHGGCCSAAGADGVVLTNTTVQRDAPTHPAQAEFLAEAGASLGSAQRPQHGDDPCGA